MPGPLVATANKSAVGLPENEFEQKKIQRKIWGTA